MDETKRCFIAITFNAWGRGKNEKEAEQVLKKNCSSIDYKQRAIYEIIGDDEAFCEEVEGRIMTSKGAKVTLIRKHGKKWKK